MNHFFSQTYGEAREKFLAACETRHLRLMRYRLPAEESPDLFIDLAWLKRDPERSLIHISGVHGVEGYAGSAIQNAILADELSTDGASILFVHALNPYGMAFYRRANSHNVDLNRNCLTNRDPAQNPDYALFDTYLNPSSPIDFFTGFILGFLRLQQLGKTRATQAIASGQTSHPGGLFYAGAKKQREIVLLQEFLHAHLKQMKTVAVLDVHTGLGAFGEELLFANTPVAGEFFSRLFQRSLDAPSLYQNRGALYEGLRVALRDTTLHYCLQEFGAMSNKKTFAVLRQENYAWKKRVLERYPDPRITQKMMHTFCPSDLAWRENIIHLGKKRFFQTLSALEQS